MAEGLTAVRCANKDCDYAFTDLEAALRETDRPLCPDCGDTERIAYVEASETVSVHESSKLKGRSPDGGKPFLEAVHSKLEWHRDLRQWREVTRVVNRRDNQYDEIIIEHETGNVVREVHEPLSEHRDRGNARKS